MLHALRRVGEARRPRAVHRGAGTGARDLPVRRRARSRSGGGSPGQAGIPTAPVVPQAPAAAWAKSERRAIARAVGC
jgi:hypothetical protein